MMSNLNIKLRSKKGRSSATCSLPKEKVKNRWGVFGFKVFKTRFRNIDWPNTSDVFATDSVNASGLWLTPLTTSGTTAVSVSYMYSG